MKNSGFNPFLPSWEYIPDGEPRVFEDSKNEKRVYIYGSHDRFNGYAYCMNDYVCWSAPENDLTDWRFEGVIYKKTDDPYNKDASMHLYAPDVILGADGRYYLYYVLDKINIISAAVCDTPAGKYEHYGIVRYEDGIMLGRKEGDVPQFDPALLNDSGRFYLYSGQCAGRVKPAGENQNYSIGVELMPDMLTVKEGPFPIIPGKGAGEGSGFEGHEFFEASSIRKIHQTYYFIYSSFLMNELCYATSKNPLKDFKYGGVIVSNADLGIDSYKPADKMTYHGNNNHGSIQNINGNWYVFYHRHTNGNEFSRQACLEPIKIDESGYIKQVEMTSCGPAFCSLAGKGEYPAYIACNIFSMDEKAIPSKPYWPNRTPDLPFITQDSPDIDFSQNDDETGIICNILDNCVIGFKYFDCKEVTSVKIKLRGYCKGFFEVKTSWDSEPIGKIDVISSNIWKYYSAQIKIPDGKNAIYFVYRGSGTPVMGSFALE